MSKFDPPKPQSLSPSELVQAISRFGADPAGVAKAVELIQIQDQLKAQDEADLASWVADMVADSSPKAQAALRAAGFDETGVYLGADLAPSDISEPMPESETRVENRRVILETGLEGHFGNRNNEAVNLTRHGKPLNSPAAALETATADIVTYFEPKSRVVDEVPVLGASIGLAAAFGFALVGNGDPLGLILGYAIGSVFAVLASRFGKGFPGIFALTSFGVVGARILRGVLASAMVFSLISLAPDSISTAEALGIPAISDVQFWAALISCSILLGLLVSGKALGALRIAIAIATVLAGLGLALVAASGISLSAALIHPTQLIAGALLAFLSQSTLAFSTTVGATRFHLSSAVLGTLAFSTFLMMVVPSPNAISAQFFCALVALILVSSFAAASTSRGRFGSGLIGAAIGLASVIGLGLLSMPKEFTFTFVVSLTGAWLSIIAFDAAMRKGRLHLASLNRSYGFYGPASWLAILIFVFSGFLGASVALFSPLIEMIPAFLSAPVLSMLLAAVFSLIRLPEIRAQEDEIVIAVSRASAGNQVGFN